MRIERLVLERYGHFTAMELDLSDRATRLFVVCGNNEAGKTTALNAIGDLLFGIDARSPYAFVHGYADMRIGGEISARDGATLGFKRRKGQKNTLLAADDRPLADEALKPFLGDADRELFLRLFGLTHQSLASGAAAMLDAKGDVGQVLFEAGGSIRRLVQVRRGLDEEASQLFTPRRAGSKKLYTALDVYDQARSELRRLSITPDDFRRASDELAAARAELGATYARLKTLQTERARNERIRRLLPGLANLTQDRKDLAALADAADLSADAGDRVARAHEQMRLATAAAEREERAAAEAIGELEGLCLPEALLARADDIRLMHERRGAILKARDDLPNRRAERHQLAGELERLARDLG
ncbi:MAG: AAA family ATPase, partial [Defluviicoccus sp.]